MNCFTENGQWELWIDFQFANRTWSHIHYKQFKVGNNTAEYPLTIGGFTGVTPTDPFKSHNGLKFTTIDNDNDKNKDVNCATSNNAWWHHGCYHFNANRHGSYVYLDSTAYFLNSVEMKMRQHDSISQ